MTHVVEPLAQFWKIFVKRAGVRMQVHGDSIMREPRLRKRAAALERGLKGTWGRVDGLFQGTRSMLSFLGNLAG